MAGQGPITNRIAALLEAEHWTIVYKCLPNTPHIGVVPITTADSTARQRYPDILAYLDNRTKLIEVEISLNEVVANDIITRFSEQVAALNDQAQWNMYRQHILDNRGLVLPMRFQPECDLVICNHLLPRHKEFIQILNAAHIQVVFADDYRP